MSDRFSGSVSVYGKVTEEQFSELNAVLNELGNFEDDGMETLSGYFSDCDGRDFEAIKLLVSTTDLWLVIQWTGHYEYSSFVEYYHKDLHWVFDCDNDGHLQVAIDKLQESSSMTVEDFLKTLDIPELPEFELIED